MRWFKVLLLAWPLGALAQPTDAPTLSGAAQKAVSRLAGELRAQGLRQPVKVLRDRWGVAHIYARNQHDLFFAQGMVAAQDRLFQMEVWKRAGQGRLSELLGPAALARDVQARRLQYRGDMQKEYASYAPDTLAILTAFTDGINAYIASLRAPGGPGLPVEFALAGFTPDAWQPRDCLNRLAAFSMTGNATSELSYARALADLGAAGAARVVDFDPPARLEPTAGMDLHGLGPELLKDLVGSDQRIEFPSRSHEGSNNWTIAGALTASGMPLLANDPHRVIALPSLRYLVHLVAPGWNVIGAGEPGLPGVALGHNEQIAWGFTVFGLDQQDLYVEELDPANPSRYKTPDGWQTMKVRRETFQIKGEQPRVVELKFTRHGPVLWEDGRRALALRWVGSEPGTAGYLASLAIDRARNWNEFESAMARWKVPSENLVYADRAGNIGEHSVGLTPRRAWTGLLPVPGAGRFEWSGFVPTAELPHSFNPKNGFVATANDKMIPERYPYAVGFEWDPGYRATRIRSAIGEQAAAGHRLTVEDMATLQNDDLSLPALQLQTLVRSTPLAHEAELAGFLRWDGRLRADSTDAALYEVWLRQICLRLGAAVFPADGERYSDLSPRLALAMLGRPEPALFGSEPTAGRDRLLIDALRAAQQYLAQQLGPDMAQWSWGRLHTMRMRHPLDQQPGAMALMDPGPVPRPGDGFTVNATDAGKSWEQVDGASYRQILDAGDWDRSIAINTPGQSGQPSSAHYADLLPLWAAGQYFPLSYSRAAVEANTTDRLLLLP